MALQCGFPLLLLSQVQKCKLIMRPHTWLFSPHRSRPWLLHHCLMPPVLSTQQGLRLRDSWEARHHLHTTPQGLEASVVSSTFGFLSTASSQVGSMKWLERPIHPTRGERCCSKGMNSQGVQGKGKEGVIPPGTCRLSREPSQCPARPAGKADAAQTFPSAGHGGAGPSAK